MFAAKPQPIKNSVKYRDAGAKPATGRSGSAAIEVRALRTQTEASIQVAAVPAGKLDKVQVKIFNSSGDVVVTDNYRKGTLSGGTGTFSYDWPMRGQKVQVQANVSGIDANRTDVVTVDTTVKLLPDLTVASISAPRQAYIGSVVPVTAVIREANGDLGARANCVLKADGVVVDHADGIWVDAGDAVTCEFRTLFNSLGTKQLTAEVTNVVPTDFNPLNNSATTSIDIVSASTPVWYTMSAFDTTYDQNGPFRYHEEFTSFDPSLYQSYVRDNNGTNTSTTHVPSYGASLQIEKAIEFPVAVDSRLIVDGQTLLQTTGSIDYNPSSFMNYSGDGYWNKCGDFYDGWQWMFACHFHSEFDGVRDLSTVFSSRNAGAVTYASIGTSVTRWADGTVDAYSYNYPGSYVTGDVVSPIPDSLGNHVTVQGAFTDANSQHFDVEASVDLFPIEPITYDYGEYCYNYDYSSDGWGRFTGYQCSWPVTIAHGTAGWSSGLVQQ
jgi:hypothetical protein